jgi:hypothetical protein
MTLPRDGGSTSRGTGALPSTQTVTHVSEHLLPLCPVNTNYWPYGIDRSKARDAHPLAEAASVDAVPFNHP